MTTKQPWEIQEQWERALALRIWDVMKRRRMTLWELSRAAGVCYTTLWENVVNGRKMPAYRLFLVARALNVSASELMGL